MTQKLIALFFSLLVSLSIIAQEEEPEMNKVIEHVETGEPMLIGPVTVDGFLMVDEFAKVYTDIYESYQPDMDLLRLVNPRIKYSSVVIIMATWCQDSQEQLPRFMKVIEALEIPMENVQIIAVNHLKDSEDNIDPINTYDLELVPTFIFFNRLGDEIGRIVETPEKTMEESIYQIFKP